jgi:hypothetical protein
VEVVRAADGVGERTAAPLSTAQLAAGVPIRTLISATWTNYVLRLGGFNFREKWNNFVSLCASISRNVASVAIGAAVEVV